MIEGICKGSWVLGTACGHCQRCNDEASSLIPELRNELKSANFKYAKCAGALALAPQPTTKPNAEWMVSYMDWFFQTRANATAN